MLLDFKHAYNYFGNKIYIQNNKYSKKLIFLMRGNDETNLAKQNKYINYVEF